MVPRQMKILEVGQFLIPDRLLVCEKYGLKTGTVERDNQERSCLYDDYVSACNATSNERSLPNAAE